jgi:hypothetical protein
MNFRTLTTGAYLKLHELIASCSESPLVPFLGYEYPEGSPDIRYQWQEHDFTRELVNAFNTYAFWVWRLGLWEEVLRSYAGNDVLELRREFTALPFDYCLSAPYMFKSRIIFCATQLCYTEGLSDKLISQKEISTDYEIDMNALVKVAKHWHSGSELVKALKEVNGQQYRDATGNYRNKSQHRHPPCLDFGLTANVVRSFPGANSGSYSFGETPPLATSDALPALVAEADRMKAAFLAYRALVEEHTGITNEV